MDKNLAEAYGKAQEIQEMKKRNPRLENMSAGDRVKTLLRKKGERGSPKPVDKSTKPKNDQAVKDFIESKGIFNLPTVSPKLRKKPTIETEELEAEFKVGGETGDQRVDYGELGNPYMKRGKSKYGM